MSYDLQLRQRRICAHYGASFAPSPPHLKLGVSKNLKDGIQPLNGLRHPPAGDATGWYIWAGELSNDPAFFMSIPVAEIDRWAPAVVKYLGLPPGWRFLCSERHEDVWFDSALLSV